MIKVSNELLSAVLGKNVIKSHPSIEGDRGQSVSENKLTIVVDNGVSPRSFYYNIYELADKVMGWIESQGFWIRIIHRDCYELIYKSQEVYYNYTKTRIDVPFMCGQWILDNQK